MRYLGTCYRATENVVLLSKGTAFTLTSHTLPFPWSSISSSSGSGSVSSSCGASTDSKLLCSSSTVIGSLMMIVGDSQVTPTPQTTRQHQNVNASSIHI